MDTIKSVKLAMMGRAIGQGSEIPAPRVVTMFTITYIKVSLDKQPRGGIGGWFEKTYQPNNIIHHRSPNQYRPRPRPLHSHRTQDRKSSPQTSTTQRSTSRKPRQRGWSPSTKRYNQQQKTQPNRRQKSHRSNRNTHPHTPPQQPHISIQPPLKHQTYET